MQLENLILTTDIVKKMLVAKKIGPFLDENGKISDRKKVKGLFDFVVVNSNCASLTFFYLLIFNLFKFRIDSATKFNKDGSLDVNIDARYFKHFHSRHYNKILTNLQSVGLIDIDHFYLPEKFAGRGKNGFLKTITLSPEIIEICRKLDVGDEFQTIYLEKIYKAYREINGGNCKMELADWVKLQMDQTIKQLADTTPTLSQEDKQLIGVVKTFRNTRNGRVFNGLTNIKKTIRQTIVKHHQLVEIDAVTSQPALIAAIGTLNDQEFLNLYNQFQMETGNTNNDIYFRPFTVSFARVYQTALAECGDLYEYIAQLFNQSRDSVKGFVFPIFYGTQFTGDNKILSDINRYFEAQLGRDWSLLKKGNLHKKLRSQFALFLQWVESKIFIEPINNNFLKDKIFFTIHDCIYCEPSVKDWFINTLTQQFLLYFPKAGQMRLKIIDNNF